MTATCPECVTPHASPVCPSPKYRFKRDWSWGGGGERVYCYKENAGEAMTSFTPQEFTAFVTQGSTWVADERAREATERANQASLEYCRLIARQRTLEREFPGLRQSILRVDL